MTHTPIIKRAQMELAAASTGTPSPAAAPPARCKARKGAVLVEDGGRPVAIEVTCSCGETTLVELEFPSAPAATEERKTT